MERNLYLLAADDSPISVELYADQMKKGNPVILLNSRNSLAHLEQCMQKYQPMYVCVTAEQRAEKRLAAGGYRMESEHAQYQIWRRASEPAWSGKLHPGLAVLLSTSGSTGSSKMVMLSYENLRANAEAIIRSLQIRKGDRAAVMLPISYSYGLSVVNSYLLSGGELLFPKGNIVQTEYWDSLEQMGVQAICGVPYTYRILQRLKIMQRPLQKLKLMTQAGGGLSLSLQQYFLREAQRRQIHFAVMYGQTEATARMSCFFLDEHTDKLGSVGQVIPGGAFRIEMEGDRSVADSRRRQENLLCGKEYAGEILYQGRNISMGYACSWKDLLVSECVHPEYVDHSGWLHTGDLGWLDADGYLYLTGRKKRILKLRGYRVNLDELQEKISECLRRDTVCIAVLKRDSSRSFDATAEQQKQSTSEELCVVLEQSEADVSAETREEMERVLAEFCVSRNEYKICITDRIPRGGNGKVQYEKLFK